MINNSRPGKAIAAIAAVFAVASAPLALAACGDRRGVPPGYQGVIELDERHLGFELAGRLKDVPVVRGEIVKRGQVLARLDDGLERPVRDARAAELEAARAQLALLRAGARPEDVRGVAAQVRAAQANLAKIQINLKRARKLLAQGAVNVADVDNLEQDARRAAEEVRAQQERLRLLRAGSRPEELDAAKARAAAAAAVLAAEDERLRRHVLAADSDGAVVDVHLKPGELAGPATPVVTMADTAHPYVDVFIPIAELPGVVVGRKACIRVDGDATRYDGKVEDIGRQTEFTPRFLFSDRERPNLVVRVRVRIADPQRRLHAGIPAFATWDSQS